MRKYLCNLRTYYVNFRATSLKYCYLHVLNFYLDNGVMTTPKRRFLSFAFTVLSFKKSLLIVLCYLLFIFNWGIFVFQVFIFGTPETKGKGSMASHKYCEYPKSRKYFVMCRSEKERQSQ